MDQNRFDALTRTLSGIPSRRHMLRGLLNLGLGLGAMRLPDIAEAKKKRKRKKRKNKNEDKNQAETPILNAFGCVDVGNACKSPEQCCSGICTEMKGKQTCQAHDTNGCQAGAQPEGCGGTDVACTTSLGSPGTCGTTTGNAGYCLTAGDCYACKTDLECQTLLDGKLGPNAACIRCAECTETGGTACAAAFITKPI